MHKLLRHILVAHQVHLGLRGVKHLADAALLKFGQGLWLGYSAALGDDCDYAGYFALEDVVFHL